MRPEFGKSYIFGLINLDNLSLLGTFFNVATLELAFCCCGVYDMDCDSDPSIEFGIMI